ncbi:MAG TPA: DNA gyrase C-terminal beta-propeller domain-containing protein, partial [Patescibacteria group bacterium]|nr:DNA gyrase C-terminal beta-propeller domain-containing protein [Patescibacteria group bacterium]
KDLNVLTITENGFGKQSKLGNYKVQNRGGSGIRTLKVSSKTGQVIKGIIIDAKEEKDNDILVISEKGQVIRIPFKGVNVLGRDTQGVRLMRFKQSGDKVVTFSKIITQAEEKK